jgi:carbonic anhydrase
MEKLIKGVHHFASKIFASKKELFEHLALGQRPDVLFITCSDSRVDPQLITQADPGDLFTLRNIGNLVPTGCNGDKGVGAAIEYALAFLEVKHIVVCGHSHCGAMRALIDPDGLTDLPFVSTWLSHAEETRRIIQDNYKGLEPEQLLNIAVQENVLVQLENLRSYPSVADAIERGDLTLQGWVYKFESGEIFIYHPEQAQFLSHTAFGELATIAAGRCVPVSPLVA